MFLRPRCCGAIGSLDFHFVTRPNCAASPMTSAMPKGVSRITANDGLRVGAWWVDAKGGALRQGDTLVRVEPKVMDVLVYLASRAGEVVARQDLEQDVWRGALVGYDAVTKTVIKLRHALGDDSRHPRYIETVPKRGYRLIAEVDVAPRAEESGGGAHEPLASGSHLKRRFTWAIGLAGAAVGALLLLLAVFAPEEQRDSADASLLPSEVMPAPTRVVVLPFEVLGRDPDQLYLARGLTADLISALSSFSGLLVTAGPIGGIGDGSASRIASGAGYQVWGAVQRTDDHIRAEVRLTEAGSGRQLAIERYDRPFEDLFEIQDDMSSRLAKALSVTLSEVEQRRVAGRYTRSVTAYDLFLKGQAQLLVRRAAENDEARHLYLQAIAEDPTFARAYAGLALTYAAEYRNQWVSDGPAALARALDIAETAVEIDPSLPEAHWALAYVKEQQRRHGEALEHLDQALRIAPRFADALALKAGIKTYIGAPAETVPLIREAMRLDPSAGYLYFMILGRAYFFTGDQDQAIINLREAASRNPEMLEVRIFLAAALERGGRHEEAAWEAEEILAIRPDFSAEAWLESHPMTDEGQIRQLVAALADLGL